jgi:hypothetical protein
VLQLRRLVVSFLPRLPGFDTRLRHVGFVVDKVTLGLVFSEYFGSPCQSSFHQLLHTHHLYIVRGWYGRPVSGRRAKWTRCVDGTARRN